MNASAKAMSSSSPLIAASSALAVAFASSVAAPQFNPAAPSARGGGDGDGDGARVRGAGVYGGFGDGSPDPYRDLAVGRDERRDGWGEGAVSAHLASARVTARSMMAAATSVSAPPPVAATAVVGWSRASSFVGAPFSSMRPSRYARNLRSTFFWDLVGANLWTSRRMVYGGQHVRSSTG